MFWSWTCCKLLRAVCVWGDFLNSLWKLLLISFSIPLLFFFSWMCVTWGVLRQRYAGWFFRKSFLTRRSISTKYNQRANTACRGSVIFSLPALSAGTWALSRVRASVRWRSALRLCGAAEGLMASRTVCVLGRKRDSLAFSLGVF